MIKELAFAAAGGLLVYWWIKRTCPCSKEHETLTAPAATSSPAIAESPPPFTDTAVSDLFDDPATVTSGAASGGDLFPDSSSGVLAGGAACKDCDIPPATMAAPTKETSGAFSLAKLAPGSFGAFDLAGGFA